MAAVTICSDFEAPKNKISHCFHYPIDVPCLFSSPPALACGLAPWAGFPWDHKIVANCSWYPYRLDNIQSSNNLLLASVFRIGNLAQKPFRTRPLMFHWSGWVTCLFLNQSLTRGIRVTTTGFPCPDPLSRMEGPTYLCQGGQRDRPFLVSSPGSSSSEGILSFYFPEGFMPRFFWSYSTASP